MPCKVELVPISEGNRITVKPNEKVIVGRGSSLGCDDKKISRQHAELILKSDETLWIKPTHINPVFYRPLHGKTSHLPKDVEQQLNDGDQIGLLPTSFFFRASISKDVSNHTDDQPTNRADMSSKRKSPDVEPKPTIAQKVDSSPVKHTSQSESADSDKPSRKLPAWMSASTSTPSRTDRVSSSSRSSTKRQLSSEESDNSNANGSSDVSSKDASTAAETASTTKAADGESAETFDSVSPKKHKSTDKPRTRCQYGATCYRKNPAHRSEQSHPDDSDYEDEKGVKDDSNDDDKPPCPYGKTCYRQNPQHKRDYKH